MSELLDRVRSIVRGRTRKGAKPGTPATPTPPASMRSESVDAEPTGPVFRPSSAAWERAPAIALTLSRQSGDGVSRFPRGLMSRRHLDILEVPGHDRGPMVEPRRARTTITPPSMMAARSIEVDMPSARTSRSQLFRAGTTITEPLTRSDAPSALIADGSEPDDRTGSVPTASRRLQPIPQPSAPNSPVDQVDPTDVADEAATSETADITTGAGHVVDEPSDESATEPTSPLSATVSRSTPPLVEPRQTVVPTVGAPQRAIAGLPRSTTTRRPSHSPVTTPLQRHPGPTRPAAVAPAGRIPTSEVAPSDPSDHDDLPGIARSTAGPVSDESPAHGEARGADEVLSTSSVAHTSQTPGPSEAPGVPMPAVGSRASTEPVAVARTDTPAPAIPPAIPRLRRLPTRTPQADSPGASDSVSRDTATASAEPSPPAAPPRRLPTPPDSARSATVDVTATTSEAPVHRAVTDPARPASTGRDLSDGSFDGPSHGPDTNEAAESVHGVEQPATSAIHRSPESVDQKTVSPSPQPETSDDAAGSTTSHGAQSDSAFTHPSAPIRIDRRRVAPTVDRTPTTRTNPLPYRSPSLLPGASPPAIQRSPLEHSSLRPDQPAPAGIGDPDEGEPWQMHDADVAGAEDAGDARTPVVDGRDIVESSPPSASPTDSITRTDGPSSRGRFGPAVPISPSAAPPIVSRAPRRPTRIDRVATEVPGSVRHTEPAPGADHPTGAAPEGRGLDALEATLEAREKPGVHRAPQAEPARVVVPNSPPVFDGGTTDQVQRAAEIEPGDVSDSEGDAGVDSVEDLADKVYRRVRRELRRDLRSQYERKGSLIREW